MMCNSIVFEVLKTTCKPVTSKPVNLCDHIRVKQNWSFYGHIFTICLDCNEVLTIDK